MKALANRQLIGGAILAAAFLGGVALAPAVGTFAAAQLSGTTVGQMLGKGGPGTSAEILTAAASYIGITEAALRTELAAGKSLAEVAIANGKTRDGLIAALRPVMDQQLGQLVDRKGLSRPKVPGVGHFGTNLHAAAAAYLGISEADLATRVRAGETLAAIASSLGKDRGGLIQALVAAATADIQAAQAAGRITADQATRMIAGLTDKMTRLVDSAAGPKGPGRGRK